MRFLVLQVVLVLHQVAVYFGVSPTTVLQWIRRGYLHNVNQGAKYRKEIQVAQSEVQEIERLGRGIRGLSRTKYPEVVFHLRKYHQVGVRWNGEETSD